MCVCGCETQDTSIDNSIPKEETNNLSDWVFQEAFQLGKDIVLLNVLHIHKYPGMREEEKELKHFFPLVKLAIIRCNFRPIHRCEQLDKTLNS